VYVRGLIEHGGRKSLQPTLFRLGEDAARYESLGQFLADSQWNPGLLVRAGAERVVPELDVAAWVVDDTGIAKDGRHSPGVKRRWSGTLGKVDNCQITVSVHAVGERGTLPLGWALYLPEEWCQDLPRHRKAKIPDDVVFQTKPELASELCERAGGWEIPRAPVLGDSALRRQLRLPRACMRSDSSTCSRSAPRSASSGPRRRSRSPSASRPAARQASRGPTASTSRSGR
jgi:SRSO17 transposase